MDIGIVRPMLFPQQHQRHAFAAQFLVQAAVVRFERDLAVSPGRTASAASTWPSFKHIVLPPSSQACDSG